jgi:hypothetical protein
MDFDLPILENETYLNIIMDFINNELELLSTLNDVAEKYTSFINEVDGERYSFTMLTDNVAIMLKETKEKDLMMSRVVTILSDTFEKTEYLLPDSED